MSDNRPPEVLAVSECEAGRLLGISGRTVFKLRMEGRISAVKLGAGKKSHVIYPISELRRFLAANSTRSAEVSK